MVIRDSDASVIKFTIMGIVHLRLDKGPAMKI